MEGLENLNHPLAVVALLSVIFGFLTMAVDKLFYFLRGVNKTTPMDKLAVCFEGLKDTMGELNSNLRMLNQEMKHHVESSRSQNEILLYEVREMKKEIGGKKT